VAKKRAIGRYPNAFRKMAVERLKSCDNIAALPEELGMHRRCFTSGVISWNRWKIAKENRPTSESESCDDKSRS